MSIKDEILKTFLVKEEPLTVNDFYDYIKWSRILSNAKDYTKDVLHGLKRLSDEGKISRRGKRFHYSYTINEEGIKALANFLLLVSLSSEVNELVQKRLI